MIINESTMKAIGFEACRVARPFGVLLVAIVILVFSRQAALAQNCLFPSENFWGEINLLSFDDAIPGVPKADEFEFISKLAAGQRPPQLLALENISADPRSPYGVYARPVGRVDVEFTFTSNNTERSCLYPCTGWLIAPSLVITNAHCMRPPASETPVGVTWRASRANFLLGFEANLLAGEFYEVDPKPLEVGDIRDLDYAVLEVIGGAQPGERYGTVKPYLGKMYKGHDLIVIGHPMGFRKQIIRANCFNTEYPYAVSPFLYHQCSTVGGMSGSPLLDGYSGGVIALHKGAVASNMDDGTNRAVLLSRIAENSDIVRKAMAGIDPLRGGNAAVLPPPDPCRGKVKNSNYLDARCADPNAGIAYFPLTAALGQHFKEDAQLLIEAVRQGNTILQRARADGVDCPLELRLVAEPIILDDALLPSQVASAGDFELLSKLPANVIIVGELFFCGRQGPGFAECTRIHDFTVLERKTLHQSYAGMALLHGVGHLSGALHSDVPNNVMNQNIAQDDVRVDAPFCARVAAVARENLTALAVSLPR